MKRFLIVAVAMIGFALPSHAQFAVIDPANIATSIINTTKQIVETSTTASRMLSNFQETVKIYEQGKKYYDGAPI